MKKIILLSLVIFLCGCSKILTCTYRELYEDISISRKIVFNFKNRRYKQTDIMTFENKTDASSYFNDIKDYKEEYNLKLEDNKIVSIVEDEIKLNANNKSIKKQYIDSGYSCK